jgi:hypothetical protein
VTDPQAAQARDEQMIQARAAGASSDGAMAFRAFASGCIVQGAPGVGRYFAQPVAGEGALQRLDEVLGPSAWLIARDSVPARATT